jgi:spectinomycin phosphotransferase/16S rRNA (guanine(1405)-N(7))-methyltransferase
VLVVRTPPDEPDAATVVAAVERSWGIRLGPPVHQPLGFGSHHWLADDLGGDARWWITVDDLASHQAAATTSLDDAFAGLAAAMATARALADTGHGFVVAPVRTTAGEPIARLGASQAVVVHPFVDGRTHEWGDEVSVGQREAIVDVLAELHAVPLELVPAARTEGPGFDHRDELERAVAGDPAEDGAGPYAERAARLVTTRRGGLAAALARFDRLIAPAAEPGRLVLTHGEPHPGNLIEVDGRFVLIDWDTTRVAPPERDLATLVTGDAYPPIADGAAFDALARYEETTGRQVDRALVEAFALRWDLADAAVYLHQFRAPHTGTADDDQAWINLQRSTARLTGADLPQAGGSGRAHHEDDMDPGRAASAL